MHQCLRWRGFVYLKIRLMMGLIFNRYCIIVVLYQTILNLIQLLSTMQGLACLSTRHFQCSEFYLHQIPNNCGLVTDYAKLCKCLQVLEGEKNSQMCQLPNKPRDTDRQINREMHLIDAHQKRESERDQYQPN